MARHSPPEESSDDIRYKPAEMTLRVREQEVAFVLEQAAYRISDGEERLLDEARMERMLRGIAAAISYNASPYHPVPERVVLSAPKAASSVEAERAAPAADRAQTVGGAGGSAAAMPPGEWPAAWEPRWHLDEVGLDREARMQIEAALAMIRQREKLYGEWGLQDTMRTGRSVVLNFYGPPGTGKSMTAEAVAGALGKRVLLVDYATLESKYVGETPKNIRSAFAEAARMNAVLIFDEADSFLGKRLTHVQQSADYGVNVTRSVMLMELERFDGLVVFTTNLLQNYDEAFRRRILAHVAFGYPDEAARAAIWRLHLPVRMPRSPETEPEWLAARYDDVSGADIKDMVLFAAAVCLQRGEERVALEHFDEACRMVRLRYGERGGSGI